MKRERSAVNSSPNDSRATAWLEWRGHRWLAFAARVYLGQLFFVAALHKVAEPAGFALDVATYQFLPLEVVNFFAIVVPPIELLVGALLVLGLWTAGAAWVVSGLMVAFIIALAWALHLGLDMTCGCFASQGAAGEDPISGLTMLRDAGWLALGLYVAVFDRNPFGLDAFLNRARLSQNEGVKT